MRDCIFVTGGAGFIGSAVVRRLIRETSAEVVNIDKLTYAGNLETLRDVAGDPRHHFQKVDILDTATVAELFERYRPRAVMHLAAESHVDRSIDGPAPFIHTNIVGTYEMLENARRYWAALCAADRGAFRFHHISTDEVFGSLGQTGTFTESTPYRPRSPYSASKAASDHLVRAWYETFGLPAVVSNCSNNYGPFQYPEKLIPVVITKALDGEPIPVYGRGANVRDWLYVEDHAEALVTVLERGVPGETYNVGGNAERTNLEVVRTVCGMLDELAPAAGGGAYGEQITFVTDRPGHDFRYAIDAAKIHRDLGWTPAHDFDSGMRTTVAWYLDNRAWVEDVRAGSYDGARLGLGAAGSR